MDKITKLCLTAIITHNSLIFIVILLTENHLGLTLNELIKLYDKCEELKFDSKSDEDSDEVEKRSPFTSEGIRFKKYFSPKDEGIRYKKSPFNVQNEGVRFLRSNWDTDSAKDWFTWSPKSWFKRNPFTAEGIRFKKNPFEKEGIRFKKSVFNDEGIRFKRSVASDHSIQKRTPFSEEGKCCYEK